jgi:Mrp family chromosome partitioning ATPase
VQPWLQELGARFNYLIVNGPPMDLCADSLALSQFVDGVLLVLEANITRRDIVRRMKTRLEDLNVPLTFPIPETVYRLL